jgi:hypothetical protein
MKRLLRTGFRAGFRLTLPNGRVITRRACRWHDDRAAEVWTDGASFTLKRLDSRDHSFEELSSEEIPAETMAETLPFAEHADEDDTPQSLGTLAEIAKA